MKTVFTPRFLNNAIRIINQVFLGLRPRLLQAYGNIHKNYKGDNSEVTYLDIYIENTLRQVLESFDSTIGFQGEETGMHGNPDVYWLTDPIDGTSLFIRGMPFCTNMIALINNGIPICSVIYNFVFDEFYHAVKGRGAFLNGEKISVADTQELSGAIFAIEVDVRRNNNRDYFANLWNHGANEISLFCAGYELAYVAAGKIAGRITKDAWAVPYDLAPGMLLVEEAGGYVSTPDGGPYTVDQLDVIVCTNLQLFEQLKRAKLF